MMASKAKERVLVCLVSDQAIPNLLMVHALKPDRLVLIETLDMARKNGARRLLNALDIGENKYEGQSEVVPLESHTSVLSIMKVLKEVCGQRPDAEWMVNVAGGTKIMSIGAYEFFSLQAKKAELYYMDVAKPDEMILLPEGRRKDVKYALTCKEFLACYGLSDIEPKESISESDKRAEWLFPLARKIARYGGLKVKLNRPERDEIRKGGGKVPKNAFTVDTPEVRKAFEEERQRREKCNLRNGLKPFYFCPNTGVFPEGQILDKYTARFLTGEWLEVFVYGMLKRHMADLGISDLRIGVRAVADIVGADGNNPDPNELDVAFIRNHSLCAIECKSGMKHDKKFNALYKLVAVMAQNQALRKRVYFATTDEVIYDNDKKASGAENSASVPTGDEPVKKFVEGRAALYGMKLLTPKRIRDLASASSDEEELKLLEEALQ